MLLFASDARADLALLQALLAEAANMHGCDADIGYADGTSYNTSLCMAVRLLCKTAKSDPWLTQVGASEVR